jgi:hypothetical protein
LPRLRTGQTNVVGPPGAYGVFGVVEVPPSADPEPELDDDPEDDPVDDDPDVLEVLAVGGSRTRKTLASWLPWVRLNL